MAHIRLTSRYNIFIKFLVSISLALTQAYGQEKDFSEKKISHTLFITANTGLTDKTDVLNAISAQSRGLKSTSLLLVGNVTGKKGFPSDPKARAQAKEFLLEDLLKPLKEFKGPIYLTPGENEWNSGAPENIDDLESFLQDNSNSEFWPDDGCPIERESLTDQIELVSVDSQWFLEDWDKYPTMNSDCDYKTREEFFTEFKDDLKDSQGKLVIVAVHHPVMSNMRIPFTQKITGFKPENFTSEKQKELRGKLETLASLFEDIIFVSGNHKNLQLLHNGRNPQIISGAAGPIQPARKKGDGIFVSNKRGFVKLTVFEDRSSRVHFYELQNEQAKLIESHPIRRERAFLGSLSMDYPQQYPPRQTASIYKREETSKTDLYRLLWGDRYRTVYSQEIKAPVLMLDSLPGNVRPIAEGGGQQSRSLRLINDFEKEYTLRAMRKDPIQYLQADVVQTNFVGKFLKNTIAQRFVADFFTTAHPYAPFAVNELSAALNIHHTNPKIYYVPKQQGLGIYNEDYGNALFMLEEHVGDENKSFKTFGSPDDILSTADLLLEMRESKKSYVDQSVYIRARIFDMLIGDWDRHPDQWRWAQFQDNGKKRYEPIPRDRDHAFSKYDGLLLPLVKGAIPQLRKMQSYDKSLESVKWFNLSGYPLDNRFITNFDWEEWKRQVSFIQEHLTPETIDSAFASLPAAVVDNKDILEIKKKLLLRKNNLLGLVRSYYDYLQEFQTVTGTESPDRFEITRKKKGITDIKIFQDQSLIFSKSYAKPETKEIWVYGLDGEDHFHIQGTGESLIPLKFIGGKEKDTYNFQNPKKAKLYDYKSTKSEIINPSSKKRLVDSYDINQFHYTKRKYTENKILPVADYVTDAGLTLGLKNIYTKYGLVNNPFHSQYILSAQYYFSSSGYELSASAEWAHIFYEWNFKFAGRYSSPNYFINYFGSGNNTTYDRDAQGTEYNRAKLEQFEFKPSLVWQSNGGARFSAGPIFETVQVNYDENSYLATAFSADNSIFDQQRYTGIEVNLYYENKNNPSYPSLGSHWDLQAGFKQNIDEYNNKFGYLSPSFSVNYPLIPSGFAVIATKIGGDVILGEEFEFYHAATLGGNGSLRGYRNHRFNGKYAFFHSTDLRTALGLVRTDFIPLIVGVSAGFDYGRVWIEDEDSHQWHTNYGGSVWINGFYALTANIGYYHGGDGNRFTFTLNFKY